MKKILERGLLGAIERGFERNLEESRIEDAKFYGLPETATHEEINATWNKKILEMCKETCLHYRAVDQEHETDLETYYRHMFGYLMNMANHFSDSPENFETSHDAYGFLIALKKFHGESLKVPFRMILEKDVPRYFDMARLYFRKQNIINDTNYPTELSDVLEDPQ